MVRVPSVSHSLSLYFSFLRLLSPTRAAALCLPASPSLFSWPSVYSRERGDIVLARQPRWMVSSMSDRQTKTAAGQRLRGKGRGEGEQRDPGKSDNILAAQGSPCVCLDGHEHFARAPLARSPLGGGPRRPADAGWLAPSTRSLSLQSPLWSANYRAHLSAVANKVQPFPVKLETQPTSETAG